MSGNRRRGVPPRSSRTSFLQRISAGVTESTENRTNEKQENSESVYVRGNPVPSDESTFKSFLSVVSHNFTIISFTILLASGVSAFLIFKNDLASAIININKNEVKINGNYESVKNLDKKISVEENINEYTKREILSIQDSNSQLEVRLRKVEIQQVSHTHNK